MSNNKSKNSRYTHYLRSRNHKKSVQMLRPRKRPKNLRTKEVQETGADDANHSD